jgi:hypothetical protein
MQAAVQPGRNVPSRHGPIRMGRIVRTRVGNHSASRRQHGLGGWPSLTCRDRQGCITQGRFVRYQFTPEAGEHSLAHRRGGDEVRRLRVRRRVAIETATITVKASGTVQAAGWSWVFPC